tara:strand:- start:10169 stop:10912 length:744 start_codon:yes stop_codon:yes gene_type:complete
MASGAATSTLTARFLLPDLMERGRANVLSCPLWQDGALVAPTEAGSTITIWDGPGTEQVSAAAITVTGSIATYSHTPAASVSYGEGWRVEWSLIVAGVTHVVRNDGALVRNVLYPGVTDADLFRRHRALDPSSSSPLSSVTSYQDYRDEAWATLMGRLIAKGDRPNLILSPSALRDVHLALTLALIFADFSTSLNETYGEKAADYREQYQDAWADLNFIYAASDEDDQGTPDTRRAAVPSIWLSGRH